MGSWSCTPNASSHYLTGVLICFVSFWLTLFSSFGLFNLGNKWEEENLKKVYLEPTKLSYTILGCLHITKWKGPPQVFDNPCTASTPLLHHLDGLLLSFPSSYFSPCSPLVPLLIISSALSLTFSIVTTVPEKKKIDLLNKIKISTFIHSKQKNVEHECLLEM